MCTPGLLVARNRKGLMASRVAEFERLRLVREEPSLSDEQRRTVVPNNIIEHQKEICIP